MRSNAGKNLFWPLAAVFVLAGAAFCIACRLLADPSINESTHEKSIAAVLLGDSRAAVADGLYKQADTYFHKGVPYLHQKAFTNSWFQFLGERIAPTGHVHTEGKAINEIMPWLRFATRMDPRNVEPWLVAAFWLAVESGHPELAEEVLTEAQQHNPRSYRIQLEKGRLYLKQKRVKQSIRAFDRGLRLWPGYESPEDEDARTGKASLLMYRALLHEAERRPRRAIEAYRDILTLFPERTNLIQRIAALERGRQPSISAAELWESMLDAPATVCTRETHHTKPAGHGQHHEDH